MIWYKNMTPQQKKDFKKVIIVAVIVIGIIGYYIYGREKGEKDIMEKEEEILRLREQNEAQEQQIKKYRKFTV